MASPVKMPAQKRIKADEGALDEEELAVVEGMPSWARQMQEALMKHTTKTVDGLRVDVDEAKAMAMESMEEVRALRMEVDQLKRQTSTQPAALRSIKQLEEDFQKLKAASSSAGGSLAGSPGV